MIPNRMYPMQQSYAAYSPRPYNPQYYNPQYAQQAPKYHHFTLLYAILLVATIITVIIFSQRYYETADISYNADLPPSFPSSSNEVIANQKQQIKADSQGDVPPPLPGFS